MVGLVCLDGRTKCIFLGQLALGSFTASDEERSFEAAFQNYHQTLIAKPSDAELNSHMNGEDIPWSKLPPLIASGVGREPKIYGGDTHLGGLAFLSRMTELCSCS